MSNTIKAVKLLIRQGKIEKAIEQVISIVQNTEYEQDSLLISQDFKHICSKSLSGLITDEEERTQKTKIAKRVLDLLDKINAETAQNEDVALYQNPQSTFDVFDLKKHWWKYVTGLALIWGGYVETLSFLKGYRSDIGKLSNLTIYVQDKNGDIILKEQGHVWLDPEGGERKKEMINDKGVAAFQNVKIGDKIRLGIDFSEPYRPQKEDSVYTVPSDGRIYLTVTLKNLGKVFGRVVYQDKELMGVIVSVGNQRDTTDDLGKYDISIPESDQRKEQEVFFKKDGFKSITKNVFPQTNQPLNVVMEK